MTMSNAKGVYNIIFSKIVKIYTKLIYDKNKQLEKLFMISIHQIDIFGINHGLLIWHWHFKIRNRKFGLKCQL